MQSEATFVRESAKFDNKTLIWNLEASYLMTTTLPVFFQDLSQTAKLRMLMQLSDQAEIVNRNRCT